MASPNLDGVWSVWEQTREIRDFVRVKRCLFAAAPRTMEVKCNVPCGERNALVLKPLAKRLRLEDGSVGQISVPEVQKQNFVST